MKKAKRIPAFCLLFLLLLSLCACSAEKPVPVPDSVYPDTAVDLALSQMSGTIVYAEIYHLLSNPDPMIGKVIRIRGNYSAFQDPETNKVYLACVVPDATACCAQGIEFVRAGEHTWPEDYPEEGTEITVTGRLDTYPEDGITYLHLTEADMVIYSPEE